MEAGCDLPGSFFRPLAVRAQQFATSSTTSLVSLRLGVTIQQVFGIGNTTGQILDRWQLRHAMVVSVSGDRMKLLPVIDILSIAVITPGPNNILVFYAAMNGGVKAAAQSLAGVICGSFVLQGFISIGFRILANNNRELTALVGIVGSTYLVFLEQRFTAIQPPALKKIRMTQAYPTPS